MRSRRGRDLYHLNEVREKGGRRKEEVSRVEKSKAVVRAVKEDVMSQDIESAFAEVSGSSASDSPRERSRSVSFNGEHPPMYVVEVTNQSTCRERKDEKWNEYA